MIDPRFPQDRPLANTLAVIVFGVFVLSFIGGYLLGRHHEYRSAVERMEAFERQAKHWAREAGR